VFIDTNIFVEVARGNLDVAATLRELARDPQVRLITGLGPYTELSAATKGVPAEEVAPRRAMVEKLGVEVVDVGIVERVEVVDVGIVERFATYSLYAEYERRAPRDQDPQAFAGHGQESRFDRPKAGEERKTIEDLPHLAEAYAQGAEILTADALARRNALLLGIAVAPESPEKIPGGRTSAENILKAFPEITLEDLERFGGRVATWRGRATAWRRRRRWRTTSHRRCRARAAAVAEERGGGAAGPAARGLAAPPTESAGRRATDLVASHE
jgi:hypothetical protein